MPLPTLPNSWAHQNSGPSSLRLCGQVRKRLGVDLALAWSLLVWALAGSSLVSIALLPQGLIRSMSGPLHSVRFASLPCCP